MSRLRIFNDHDPATVLKQSQQHAEIAAELARVGVVFEQWQASAPVKAGDSAEAIMDAYRADIDRLVNANGFNSVDVVSIAPDNPKREEMRAKFLEEHTHKEGEVRFFVDGSGLFSLHIGDKVYEVLCEKGDLISVPDGATHWFDMGPAPRFVAIRFFTNPDGWIGDFTGSDIAQRFPRYE
ncbi:acireductone dioxygenase [Lysobacteraceae bacterium NML120232]|nr:acireductone dioxygenase [Xanthomonadaceae bacterium NML08-0793]PJK10714.1 acireductone dioxygenase [Xanthomonadaceae bacterium NML120232]